MPQVGFEPGLTGERQLAVSGNALDHIAIKAAPQYLKHLLTKAPNIAHMKFWISYVCSKIYISMMDIFHSRW